MYDYLAVEGLSDYLYSRNEQAMFHLLYMGEGFSRCDGESGELGGRTMRCEMSEKGKGVETKKKREERSWGDLRRRKRKRR